ncbi:MAG TPA: SDR family NAD(P)-dependent oxidoreductase [Acidimicrobiales bacterium]|nr:SDR family NAD(P)-dependent oxidoreductase [Acidimicrobiales bacterium]
MDDFEGKVAVVTGAASGIGRGLVTRFGQEGMNVVLADVQRDALDAAASGLTERLGGDRVLAVPTDVRHEDEVEALAAATFERFGTVHVLCNNAGIGTGGLAWMVPADRWRWIVEVNLLSVAHGIRAFVPRMIEQGEGHIVNTASAAGVNTGPVMSPYYATKHAVVALSESLHFDLQMTGAPVGVSVLCPEWVRTNIAESERNRPPEVAEVVLPPDAPLEGRAILQGLVEGGLDPLEVAGIVVDSIRAGRFWIFTHDTTVGIAKRRWDAIAADGQPTLWDVSEAST